ncbi:glycosyltransferase [Flexivirga meconopsidis]|uniref:glycosyltransferase n=1 Tax=Flexivirga meconopsidis TaxID=2977121 RepID=UPI00223EC9EC|nr:glycosyltransferase [Flexivirga meconopsidis]
MTRVALLFHSSELSGAELGTVRMLRSLPDDVEVECVVLQDGPIADRLRADGRPVHVIPADPRVTAHERSRVGPLRAVVGAARSVPTVRRVARLLARLDVDAACSTSLKTALLAVPIARLAGVPLVWHLHDRIAPDYLPAHAVRLIRALARHAPASVIVNSASAAKTLPGVDAVVAHPGLTAEQIATRPRPQPTGHPVIGMVGRLSETKGQLQMVRAMPSVLAAHRTPGCASSARRSSVRRPTRRPCARRSPVSA